jgi:L-ascorbate 6-phosphate lactonase
MNLMDTFTTTPVPPDALLICALGQSGFLYKTASGLTVAVDPCLTDPVAAVDPAYTRSFPTPLPPAELRCDVLALTHDHLDHLDPGTISRLTPGAVTTFVGPAGACRHLRALGIADAAIQRLDAMDTLDLDGVCLTGILAFTNDFLVPDTLGFLLEFAGAPSVYHTGDTAFTPLLAHTRSLHPDIYMPCINGRFANMDAFEATVLGAALRCRWSVPHHFDLFALNAANPRTYVDGMREFAPETTCHVLQAGEMMLIGGE